MTQTPKKWRLGKWDRRNRSNKQTYENQSKPIENQPSSEKGHIQNTSPHAGFGRAGAQSIGQGIRQHQTLNRTKRMNAPHFDAPLRKRGQSLKKGTVLNSILWLCFYAALPISTGAADLSAQTVSEPRYTRDQPSLAVSAAPFATNGVPDIVPHSWITEAVRQEAGQRWPVFAIGTPIPCSDSEGKLICYQVPVAVGTNHFPDILTPPPAAQFSLEDLHTPELWATSNYWTFEVAARRSYYPIPHYGGGLPPFLVTYHKAFQLAQAALNDSRVRLAHYYARRPAEEFYDFATESGRRVLIDAGNLRCYEIVPGQDPFAALGKVTATRPPGTEEQRAALQHDYQRAAAQGWEQISHAAAKGD